MSPSASPQAQPSLSPCEPVSPPAPSLSLSADPGAPQRKEDGEASPGEEMWVLWMQCSVGRQRDGESEAMG